jgi:ribosomal protein S21
MYVKVTGNTDADVQRAIRTFNKKVKEAGIIQEIYSRREYVKPSVKRKLKKEQAIRRRIQEEKRERNRRKYNNN